MAPDDHDERVRGALAIALVVVLTYKKRRRARTLAECALVLGVLEDVETTEGEESEDGGSPRIRRTQQVHPRSVFSPTPWSIMLRKTELKRRDSSVARNFRRHFRISYEFFLELMQRAKHRKGFSLAARDMSGRQCIPVELKDRIKCC